MRIRTIVVGLGVAAVAFGAGITVSTAQASELAKGVKVTRVSTSGTPTGILSDAIVAVCPTGTQVSGGGYTETTNQWGTVVKNGPLTNGRQGWSVTAASGVGPLTVWALCVKK